MVSVSLAWAKLARAMSVRAAAISRRMRLVLPLRLPDEWKGPVTRLLSLRRHDPDQVQRVGDAFASQPEAGHPVERAGAYTQAARDWQPLEHDVIGSTQPASIRRRHGRPPRRNPKGRALLPRGFLEGLDCIADTPFGRSPAHAAKSPRRRWVHLTTSALARDGREG